MKQVKRFDCGSICDCKLFVERYSFVKHFDETEIRKLRDGVVWTDAFCYTLDIFIFQSLQAVARCCLSVGITAVSTLCRYQLFRINNYWITKVVNSTSRSNLRVSTLAKSFERDTNMEFSASGNLNRENNTDQTRKRHREEDNNGECPNPKQQRSKE